MSSFTGLAREADDRIDGFLNLFNWADSVDPGIDSDSLAKLKGLAFIEAYGCYEFVLYQCVREYLACWQLSGKDVAACSTGVLVTGFSQYFQACKDSGKPKKWIRAVDLTNAIRSGQIADLNTEVFPDDGSHLRIGQLQSLWNLFELDGDPLPEPRLHPLIGELVERRNAVAHGRERSDTVGGNYSPDDIRRKLDEVRSLCSHIIQCFSDKADEISP